MKSSHQLEPVRVWPPINILGYMVGPTEKMITTEQPAVNEWIAKSFKGVGKRYRLTLDFWVKTISEEINQHPEECIMLLDYLNQIVTKPERSKHFSESFIHELKDELDERVYIADPLLFKEDDFELILKRR